MSATTIVLIIAIIIVVILFTILNILQYRSGRIPVSTGKPIYNMLHKYTDGHMIGSIVKKIPVGKNKDFLRIYFTVRETDEYGDEEIKTKAIIAKKRFVVEQEKCVTIVPKDIIDIPEDQIDSSAIMKFVRDQNGIELISSASKEDKEKFWDIYIKNYGGELSQKMIEVMQEVNKAKEEKQEEKKE